MDLIVIAILAAALAAAGVYLAILIVMGRRAQRRFLVLAEVAEASEGAASLEETLEAICDVIVPALADFCMIDVIEDGSVRRVAVRVAPGAGPHAERGLLERKPSTPVRISP